MSDVTADINYGVDSWSGELGNHRAKINVEEKADAVWAHIPWRRRDMQPEMKNIIIIEASTNEQVKNFVCVNINREFGDIIFEAQNAPGEYYIYYMPFEISGWQAFPTVVYPPPKPEANSEWMHRNALTPEQLPEEKWKYLSQAKIIEIQARSEFHRFDPMEVIATAEETQQILAQHSDLPYLLFPEDRKYPVRMSADLPLRWIKNGPGKCFGGTTQRGEYFTFQIGVYASQQAAEKVSVGFSDLISDNGTAIPGDSFHCFNLSGSDWWGRSMDKIFSVSKGRIGTLWFGIYIPENADPGDYDSILTIKPENADSCEVEISLSVSSEILEDCGDSELWRFSRLRWLDSTIGLGDDVVAPYMPLEVMEQTVKCLNRDVRFGKNGLPESICSNGREILAAPMSFAAEIAADEENSIKVAQIIQQTDESVTWEAGYTCGSLDIQCNAKMEFDGYLNFHISAKANQNTQLNDIHLDIPIRREIAIYMMGMGCKGGYRPKEWQWKWSEEKHQDSLWIGDTDAGLQCKLKGPDYTWPLVNIHYGVKPLELPDAWYNDGKGGCDVIEMDEEQLLIRAYSGERSLESGQELRFDFGLLITPVKPLDLSKHSHNRYYHAYHPVEQVAESGANVVNIHHANELNPYINYPFYAVDKLKEYIQNAHEKALKVKIYYTLRELTNHIAELPAVQCMGDEVFVDGPGGGDSWLQEHMDSGYAPAWHHYFADGDADAALVMAGLSRWHNYYLEGLSWLCKNVKIDGLYLDDMGYDRVIMKRMRRILDNERPGSLIDLHSWNHFNDRAGWANCLNMYMEHLPYTDSLWIGEGFDYNASPDYWLVEISGIPFGLFSEMLQAGGNPWRGMVYGMTNRLPYSGDPRPIWRIWDDFGIQDAEIIGYWMLSCPVKTDNESVLATVYARADKVLIALASWAEEPVECHLEIDWQSLGMNPDKAKIHAPDIQDFQEQADFQPSDPIQVESGRGWLLILAE